MEKLRDDCKVLRNLATIDMLNSTGMRVDELVNLDRADIGFEERECVVLGKGDRERIVSFAPEFAGKLNFYVNAVDDLIKTDSDNPTIGLFICKDMNQTEVQWAFSGIETPMGVTR